MTKQNNCLISIDPKEQKSTGENSNSENSGYQNEEDNNKVTLVAGISRELEQRGLSAGQWIKDPAAIVGGKGGGRPDMAQAGGKLTEKIPEALNAAQKLIETMIRA